MKRTLSFLIAVMFVLPLFGQSKEKIDIIPNIISKFKQMDNVDPLVLSALERHKQFLKEYKQEKPVFPKTQVDKQQLDSVHAEEFIGSAFVLESKDVYTYDQHGRPIDEIGYLSVGGSWIPDWKDAFSFTPSALIEDHIIYMWNQQWDEDEMYQYDYDAMDRLLVETVFFWDVNEWSPDYRDEYLYHPTTGEIDTIYHSNHTGNNNWEVTSKTAHQYNAQGELEIMLSLVFNHSANQFEPEMKVEYTYDTLGNNTSIKHSMYDPYASLWEYSSMEEMFYDSYGNMTEFIFYIYNPTNSSWEPFYKMDYSYDANHNITKQEISAYNSTISQWSPLFKMEFQHDNTYTRSDLILPYTIDNHADHLFKHMLTELISYEFDFTSNSWLELERVTMYYSQQTVSGIEKTSKTSFNVFPNPASSHVNVQTTDQFSNGTFELFDMQGRKVIEISIDGNTTISIDQLKSGVYFYRISDKAAIIQNGRIIKE